MKATIMKPVDVEVEAIQVNAPVRHGDEDMPYDFPFRHNDMWNVIIYLDTGKIMDWPKGREEFDVHLKVVDGGSYYLIGPEGDVVAKIEEDYVPHGVIPGSYGDYIEFTIQKNGTIKDWNPKRIDLSAFFPK